MSANPYENEPGFEDANDASDKQNQKDYIQKARLRGVPHKGTRARVLMSPFDTDPA